MAWIDNLAAWTKLVAQKYDLRLGQKLGQNFLINKKILDSVVKEADLKSGEVVLEVGAGIGTLTMALLETRVNLVTVEYDRKLIPILNKIFDSENKLKILQADILKVTDEVLLKNLGGKNFKIVANLPYEITGAFLKRFLSGKLKPSLMVLMLQKEVGERLISKPGQMSLLSLQAKLYTNTKIIRQVSKHCFYPAPRVESVVVKMDVKSDSELRQLLTSDEEIILWHLARAGFAHKRKYLLSNLITGTGRSRDYIEKLFSDSNLPKNIRAQELTIENWLILAKKFVLND